MASRTDIRQASDLKPPKTYISGELTSPAFNTDSEQAQEPLIFNGTTYLKRGTSQ